MARFSDDFINAVAAANPIEDVVGEYVNFTRSSGSNRMALCPFHSERTPSFSVNVAKQFFYCFGCGKGGGVFSFLMDIDGLSFPEAVEKLADKAGIKMPEADDDEWKRAQYRKRLRELCREAAHFYRAALISPAGTAAREYIARRGIIREASTRFGLGYAHDDFHALHYAMRNVGYSDKELYDAGLIKRSEKGNYYDTFRNRLMFPVIDIHENVISFSGRLLSGEGPKYLNGPETAIFDKGRNLFAMNLAKKSKDDFFILTEGNIDVISLHQVGFDSAVASLGTAFTENQARLLSRFKNKIVLAYDSDEAGRKAAEKAIRIFEKLDVSVKVLRLNGAKDPDEFIQRYGASAFKKLIEGSQSGMMYELECIKDSYDLRDPEQKSAFIYAACRRVAQLPDGARREIFSREIARIAEISHEVVKNETEKARKRLLRSAGKKESKAVMNVERLHQPAGVKVNFKDVKSATAEQGVIHILCRDPGAARGVTLPPSADFSSPELGGIYEAILKRINLGESTDINNLTGEISPEQMSLLTQINAKRDKLSCSKENLIAYLNTIRQCREERKPVKTPDDLMGVLKAKQEQEKLRGSGKGN